MITLPVRTAREGVNRAMSSVQGFGRWARETTSDVKNQASQLGGAARDVASAGRDASLERAETLARREGANDTAETLHDARRQLGSLSASELPIAGYPELNQQDAIRQIKDLRDSSDVRTMIKYEEANRKRSSVVSAAQTQVPALAKETISN